MVPYLSVSSVLYIPLQHHNPSVLMLKESKNVATRVALYQPKQGNRHPARGASFPSRGALVQISPSAASSTYSGNLQEQFYPIHLNLRQNVPKPGQGAKNEGRTEQVIRVISLENVIKRGQEVTLVYFNPLESGKLNVSKSESRPGKEKCYTQVASLQAQIQLGQKAECRLCENAVVLNRRTLICYKCLFEGDYLNTALCLKIVGTVSIVDSS